MNFLETIVLFFSFQAFILSILFFLKKENRVANRIFATLLFLFSYNLFYNVLYWSRFDMELLIGLLFTYQIPLSLYGGLFYLYIRSISVVKRFSWKDLIHLLPLVFVLGQVGRYIILPLSTKIQVVKDNAYSEHTVQLSFGYPLLIAILVGYAFYTYYKYVRHYKKDPELSLWAKLICLIFLLFTISHAVYCTLSMLSLIALSFDYFITFFMITMIGLVCYFAFMYAQIFNGAPIKKIIPYIKYKRTGLSMEFSLELKEKLLSIMDKEKPYCNPDIRLDSLAEMLDVSRHHASQVINEHFSVSFFDFINEYRIKEAERLLISTKEDLSITDIVYKCGFNNRVSFYKAFKKIEGTTPSAYRDHYLAS